MLRAEVAGQVLTRRVFFPVLYMHQGIVNANNLQLSEQTHYKPVSFGCLLSNDYAKLFLEHIQNHKPQPCAMYALNG